MQSATARSTPQVWTRAPTLQARQSTSPAVAYRPSAGGVTCRASSQPQESGPAEEAPEPPAAGAGPEVEPQNPSESVVFERSSSKAELAVSLLLGITLIYLPLTLASIGRYAFSKYTFTDRRIIVEFNSPIRKETIQVTYDKMREVRCVNRGLGLWGDMVCFFPALPSVTLAVGVANTDSCKVFFLKDGSRLEIVGIADPLAIKTYVEGQMNV